MPKIVVNRCFGGFCLSELAILHLKNSEVKVSEHGFLLNEEDRTHPQLVELIQKLGKQANASCSSLVVVDVPDDVDWYIDDYDGCETVREKHRSW